MYFRLLHLISFLLFLPGYIIAQEKNQPFQLKVNVNNTIDEQLFLYYQNKNGIDICDTLKLAGDGYYLNSNRVDAPCKAFISGQNITIFDLLIAPGYDLHITGDGSSFRTLRKSKHVSGKGSWNNSYYRVLDSIMEERRSGIIYVRLPREAALTYLSSFRTLKDSLANALLTGLPQRDHYSADFAKLITIDNRFEELRMVLSYADFNGYDYATTKHLLDSSFEIKDIFSDRFLVSDQYRELMTGHYLKLLLGMPQNRNIANNAVLERLHIIATNYQGPVKVYALFEVFRRNILGSGSLGELDTLASSLKDYGRFFRDSTRIDELKYSIGRKTEELLASQKGKPSPLFQGADLKNKVYTIKDFIGKVVYIDLWASWCEPCREETPYLNKIQKEYAGRNNIAFVSIAVSDNLESWKKAMAKDKPKGLQLYDRGSKTFSMFPGGLTIPRFFIIAKDGTIADFDAPRPSNEAVLKAILDAELGK